MEDIKDVKVGSLRCGYCGADANPVMLDGAPHFLCTHCSHGWEANFTGLCGAIRGVQQYLESPEATVNDVLSAAYGCYNCFGTMERRIVQHINTREVSLPEKCANAEDAFQQVIAERVKSAKLHAEKLLRCSGCGLFDRCAVLSGLYESR